MLKGEKKNPTAEVLQEVCVCVCREVAEGILSFYIDWSVANQTWVGLLCGNKWRRCLLPLVLDGWLIRLGFFYDGPLQLKLKCMLLIITAIFLHSFKDVRRLYLSLFSPGENSFTHFPRNLCSEIAIRHKVSPLSNALKKKILSS